MEQPLVGTFSVGLPKCLAKSIFTQGKLVDQVGDYNFLDLLHLLLKRAQNGWLHLYCLVWTDPAAICLLEAYPDGLIPEVV